MRNLSLGKNMPLGDKVYYNNRGKALICATLGTGAIGTGRIDGGPPIDSPGWI